MRKKDCINSLNEILGLLLDHECFDAICNELQLGEEELEMVLNSVIIDIDNDECKR
jgi:hypothetical protein